MGGNLVLCTSTVEIDLTNLTTHLVMELVVEKHTITS